MRKSFKIAFTLTFFIILSSFVSYMADAPKLSVNGVRVTFNDDLGYPYIDSNFRTMVPLKAAVEAAGASVGWDSKSKTAIILTDNVRIEAPIGTNILNINGVKVVNDTESVTINGRTYLPIKAVLEAVGYTISWDNTTKTVVANTNSSFKASNLERYQSGNLTTAVYKSRYEKTSTAIIYNGKSYKIIDVDGGNLSGNRQANIAVDIGYGYREYYGLTNQYGQLVYVFANQIILQDPAEAKYDGRYYPDEAKVPGTESATLDEGHVIADSLGGVSNAYNITPQDSTLNRYGNQAYMEKVIRDAGGASDFFSEITYSNNTTQIPSEYHFEYIVAGNAVNESFQNVNPETSENQPQEVTNTGDVIIFSLDKQKEVIVLKNTTSNDINITNWRIRSVKGDQWFTFPTFTLKANSTVSVGDSALNKVDFHWLEGRGNWNNSESDPAELYDSIGTIIDTFNE